METESAIRELLDKQAITEVIGSRYGRALDWLDFEAQKDCFWSDGWVEFLEKEVAKRKKERAK